MIRTQVQLTEAQVRALRAVAAQRGVSMAAVIRDLVEQGLQVPASARAGRARAAIGSFGSGVSLVSAEHDRELEQAFAE